MTALRILGRRQLLLLPIVILLLTSACSVPTLNGLNQCSALLQNDTLMLPQSELRIQPAQGQQATGSEAQIAERQVTKHNQCSDITFSVDYSMAAEEGSLLLHYGYYRPADAQARIGLLSASIENGSGSAAVRFLVDNSLLDANGRLVDAHLAPAVRVHASQQSAPRIAYLVPVDRNRIEAGLEPAMLQTALGDVPVAVFDEWRAVEALVDQDQLDALIIHARAAPAIDAPTLQQFYAAGELIVAVVGTDGMRLAELIGAGSESAFASSYYYEIAAVHTGSAGRFAGSSWSGNSLIHGGGLPRMASRLLTLLR